MAMGGQWRPAVSAMACLAALLSGLAALSVASAEPSEPRRLFEDKCGKCHGNAGDFARDQLTLVDGSLQGKRSQREFRAFLAHHYVRLSDQEIDTLYDLMRRQVPTGGLFEEHCRTCHEPANELAARTLVIVGGELRSRSSGRDIRAFLRTHGRLSAEQQEAVYDILRWQLQGGS